MFEIIYPQGMFGSWENEPILISFLRELGKKYSQDESEWSDKYGTNYENDVFLMHRFCWCDGDDCPLCVGCTCEDNAWVNGKHKRPCPYCKGEIEEAPNFHYKPLDFKVWWYKYIGRGMKTNKELSTPEIISMMNRLLIDQ